MHTDLPLPKDIEKTLNNLKRNHLEGFYVTTNTELLQLLNTLIPVGSTVGCGDSVTLEQSGVFDYLRAGDYCFLDKHDPTLTTGKKRELYIKNFDADIFITGTNALTTKGELFNIDGNGSRVAPILYGPKQVIVVVGINKIVNSVKEAITRTRQIAAPLDAKRLGKHTPCATLGRCVNCSHEQRICNSFVLIARQFDQDRIKVIIVNQDLGF